MKEEATAPGSVESSEKRLRKEVLDLFERSEFKAFYELRPLRVIWTFTHIWTGILLAWFVGYLVWTGESWPPKLLIPLLVFYIGTRQNALAVQIHEASHKLLFNAKSWNDLFCNVFGSWWVLNSVQAYRRVHLIHHTDLLQPTDPDLALYSLGENADRHHLLRTILKDLSGLTALQRMRSYRKIHRGKGTRRSSPLHPLAAVGCQALLAAVFVWKLGILDGTAFFLVFWCLPLFCVFPAIIRLRIVTEHYLPTTTADLSSTTRRPFVSRTTGSHFLELYLFGCDMEYHFEHHLFATIPHPQLARLHRILLEKEFFVTRKESFNYLSNGYLRFWWKLLSGSENPSVRSAA